MIYPVKTNFIPLVRNLVTALQPFAEAKFVQLQFSTEVEKVLITHHPESMLSLLTRLLCRIIAMTQQENTVTVEVQSYDQNIWVRVFNTGAGLHDTGEIISGLGQKISVRKREGGTIFEMLLAKDNTESTLEKAEPASIFASQKQRVPPFFKRLKDSLQAYFASTQHLEQAAFSMDQRAGIFLKKVNTVIMDHLDEEHFDMPALSKALVISRSQLYRRLKPIILQGPAHYIRFVRLQEAKAMLQNSDLSIGEIAFQMGFVNPSHFTRAFHEQFGFNPSDVKRSKKQQGDSQTNSLQY